MNGTKSPKSLTDMKAEVAQYSQAAGADDQLLPWSTAMVLLHEDAAAAGHAWRKRGLKDMTREGPVEMGNPPAGPPKPAGAGSEFARLLIQLLDCDVRWHLRLEEYTDSHEGAFDVEAGFLENICTLHRFIAGASEALETCYADSTAELAGVLVFLRQVCEHYGIDLPGEYERVMAYSRSHPYRGGWRF